MLMAFVWLCFTAVLPYLHRDVKLTARTRQALDGLRVTVIVPVHNEGPEMFLDMLRSVVAQSRLPQRVHVVENGDSSYVPKLREIFREWRRNECPPEIEAAFSFNPVPSKRHAQALAIEADRDADVYVTLDSDVRLHEEALARGLAPFIDDKVNASGGLVVGLNACQNLVTRLTEIGFASAFLNGRAAFSLVKSVSVQCGVVAFYRGEVFRRYLPHYLNAKIAGKFFPSGDDGMATRYALLEGSSVIQLGCLGYTLLPTNIGHLTKQRVRWWRNWFRGNCWALRAFQPGRIIWWLTVMKFLRFALYAYALFLILVMGPVVSGMVPWRFAVWLMAISFLLHSRYLSFRRPDQKFRTQLVTFLLSPVSTLLHFYLCTILQWYGLFTCLKSEWGTRQKIEVGLVPAATGQ